MGSRLETRFERCAGAMASALEHADRAALIEGYLRGLMLPGGRKGVEPMAARVDSCLRSTGNRVPKAQKQGMEATD